MNKCKKCSGIIPPYKTFCSRICKDEFQTKYTQENILFIQENVGNMNLKSIARKIGVTVEGLKRQISTLRNGGLDIAGGRYEHYDPKVINQSHRWEGWYKR